MPTFKLLKSEVKPMTLALAEEFQKLEPSPTERELKPERLKHLREKAVAGQLVTFHWARARMGGKWLRMNGQHSSNMLVALNGNFPSGLYAHLDDYEVDGPHGLALLFKQFDDRKSGRSAADVAGAYQMIEPSLLEIAKPVAKLGIEGIAWYRRTVEVAPTPSGDAIYEMFQRAAYHPFLLWLNDVFSIKTPELRRAQITAAMYATFTANETEARTFWDQTARGGVEFEDTAATTVLDKWLKDAKEGELKDELKPSQYYQGCIYGWNAFREQKPIKDIKADTRKSWHVPHS